MTPAPRRRQVGFTGVTVGEVNWRDGYGRDGPSGGIAPCSIPGLAETIEIPPVVSGTATTSSSADTMRPQRPAIAPVTRSPETVVPGNPVANSLTSTTANHPP